MRRDAKKHPAITGLRQVHSSANPRKSAALSGGEPEQRQTRIWVKVSPRQFRQRTGAASAVARGLPTTWGFWAFGLLGCNTGLAEQVDTALTPGKALGQGQLLLACCSAAQVRFDHERHRTFVGLGQQA